MNIKVESTTEPKEEKLVKF